MSYTWTSRAVLAAMMAVLLLCAFLLAGTTGIVWTGLGLGIALVLFPRIPPELVMRLHRAIPLPLERGPEIYAILSDLAAASGMREMPGLYIHPGRIINAFSTGEREDGAICFSLGAFRLLSGREIRAVMAHEVSHLASGDMGIMLMTEVLARFTRITSMTGLLVIIFVSIGENPTHVPLWVILIFAFAPTGMTLLQMKFSRTRELAADAAAVRLIGDPEALASALMKIELQRRGMLGRTTYMATELLLPKMLHSHPATSDRVRILEEMADQLYRQGREPPDHPHHWVPGEVEVSHDRQSRWPFRRSGSKTPPE